ncbi:hypothetical protein F4819DRAFT_486324 [Hypoxylon fuscum]|nr:hypothetical protein F4819DRAFT_486324 [Hypoxylon fuscum]
MADNQDDAMVPVMLEKTADTEANAMAPAMLEKTPQGTFRTKTSFLHLPFELRLEIYEYVFHPFIDGIHCLCMSYPESYQEDLQLLFTCKQIHYETTEIVYKRLAICVREIDPEKWMKFFYKIGPRNASLIKEIALTLQCHKEDWGWKGAKPYHYGYNNNCEIWWSIFDAMFYAGVKPMYFDINVSPCRTGHCIEGHDCRWSWDELPGVDRWSDNRLLKSKEPGYGYSYCTVHEDLYFIKYLSYCLENIQVIKFHGLFNNLWIHYLRQRHGFILQREDYLKCPGWFQDCMLTNPKFFDPATDAKGYYPSKSLSGVYTANTNRAKAELHCYGLRMPKAYRKYISDEDTPAQDEYLWNDIPVEDPIWGGWNM